MYHTLIDAEESLFKALNLHQYISMSGYMRMTESLRIFRFLLASQLSSLRNSVGVIPVLFLKYLEKCSGSVNSRLSAIW